MTLYTRPRDEIFASSAPPSEIQPFQAWLRGLGIAFDETNGFPELSGINGLFNALNLYIKYLEQNGFAEWRSTLEYPVGAGVRVGMVWYRAKVQNTNKPPATSQTEWELFLNATALSYQEPLYIDNNVIKIRDASNTVKGVARFATTTEVANKSNVDAFLRPSDVAGTFSSSKSLNGYIAHPNGIIEQWGYSAGVRIGLTGVNFPIPFPTFCANIQTTPEQTNQGANGDGGFHIHSKTRSDFQVFLQIYENIGAGDITGFYWKAIGY